MKRIAFLIALLLPFAAAMPAFAQNKADDIVGKWFATQDGIDSHVAITRSDDGTYKAQVLWVANATRPDGTKELDVKNPDKSLRNTPVDEIVLFSGLKFDARKNSWGGTKIYDPTRGIRANVTITLQDEDKTLRLRGSVLGIGETVFWTRMEE